MNPYVKLTYLILAVFCFAMLASIKYIPYSFHWLVNIDSKYQSSIENYLSKETIERSLRDDSLQLILEPVKLENRREELFKLNLNLKNNTTRVIKTFRFDKDTLIKFDFPIYVEVVRPDGSKRILLHSEYHAYSPSAQYEDCAPILPKEKRALLSLDFANDHDNGMNSPYWAIMYIYKSLSQQVSDLSKECFDLNGTYNIRVFISDRGVGTCSYGTGLLVSNSVLIKIAD